MKKKVIPIYKLSIKQKNVKISLQKENLIFMFLIQFVVKLKSELG